VIELRSDELWATLDPEHGAEIVRLTALRSGSALLGSPPFVPAPARAGDLDEEAWTASYRGGWQLAAPNAGAACDVEGVRHGFHGRASVDPWSLVEHDDAHAVLSWSGHGLRLRRSIGVTGARLTVELAWRAIAAPVPLIAVEHVCLGAALLDPRVEIQARARAHELADTGGPPLPPDDAVVWPGCRLLDGGVERGGSWPFDEPRSRFIALTGFDHGAAEIRNPDSGLAVRLDWDVAKLPAAWIWHELRGNDGIWDRRAELLGVEPASVPHALGLGEAVQHGQALWATRGGWDGYAMSLTVTDTRARRR